jgi:uncharacterized membrane protein YdcZ (DUF606 family)
VPSYIMTACSGAGVSLSAAVDGQVKTWLELVPAAAKMASMVVARSILCSICSLKLRPFAAA